MTSRDPERSSRDPNTLKAQYLKTAGDAIDSLLWGSTYRYPSDSLVSVLSRVFYVYLKMHHFLADRTNGRAIGTLLRPSVVVVVVCNVMYCG